MNLIEDKRNQLIKNIEKDIKQTIEEKELYNREEISNYVKRLIKLSQKEDKSYFYNLQIYDMVLICITISYSEKPYVTLKAKCEEIKSSFDAIKHDNNTLMILKNFVEVIDAKKEDEYPTYLKKLGLNSEDVNKIVDIADYALLFKPIFLLVAFKNGYDNNERILDNKIKKLSHQRNFELTLKDFIYFISKFSNELLSNDEFFTKKNELNMELKNVLEKGDIISLIPFKKDYLDYLSLDILIDLCVLIGESLNYIYVVLNEKIEDINDDLTATDLTKFLYAIGIIPESIDIDLYFELSKIEFKLLEKRAKFLFLIGLSPKDILTTYSYYLKNLSLSAIEKMTFYLNSNIISKEYIRNKISEISTIFSTIDANYEVLKPIVDFSNMYYNESILFEDLKTLKNKLSVLAEYNLTKNNFTFLLCNYDYLPIYDLMLENEIPLYLLTNICHTQDPELTIKRIILFKELSIPYETPTHELTKEVRFEKYFVCSSEELNSYFPSDPLSLPNVPGDNISDIKTSELVVKLEKDNRLDDTYLIGDTIISRPKLLKNLQYLKDHNINDNQHMISSFLSNSLINQSSLLDVSSTLNIQKSYYL